MFFRQPIKFLLDILFPPVCPICRTEVDSAHCLCPECYGKVKFITNPCCQVCGRPFEYQALGNLVCAGCMKKKPYYDMARSVLAYDDFSKQLVLSFKHGDHPELAKLFIKFLMQTDPDIWDGIDCVIPVPLHWTRRIKRKYNQAGLLGQLIAKHKRIAFCPNVLLRRRATFSQGHKKKSERERNIKNAFKVVHPEVVRDKNVLVVDDVMTTGVTVNECAKTLKRAGAKTVKVITIYRVISN